MAEYESFLFYQSWYEAAALLGEEKQTKAIMQIIRYGLYGEVPDNSDDITLRVLLASWMPQVDTAKQRRRGGAPKGNQNAKGHGAPKGNKNAAKNKQQNKQPFNGNGNGNGNGNANANGNGNDNGSSLCLGSEEQANEDKMSNEEWEAMIDAL